MATTTEQDQIDAIKRQIDFRERAVRSAAKSAAEWEADMAGIQFLLNHPENWPSGFDAPQLESRLAVLHSSFDSAMIDLQRSAVSLVGLKLLLAQLEEHSDGN